MLEIYTIYGGGMWKTALDAVVTLIGMNTFSTLMRMAGTFAVLAVLLTFIKQRNPMVFVQWLAIFMLINTILLAPKRSVQVIDISDPAAVWKTDNVPVGLAAIASLTTSVGFKIASVYDTLMARPDSITYSKTGMLFGSQIVAETSDFTTQNPELSQMLPDYVENCVIGDILLNHKYTVNELLNSSDPLGLITSNPSPLRGIFKTTSATREFLTCRDAATQIRALANTEANTASATFSMLARKIFGTKVNGATLLANAMGESYGYFYAGGMSAAQIMKNNITNSAVRQGIKGFAARSSDTANLLNLASENAATKQRLSWAAGNVLATRTLPFAQSLLMLILVCLFPLMITLAAANHSLFGLNTLKLYVGGFIYFQMWPVMFAILNYASNYWLQSKTGGTALVLANTDVVALQHSDVANLAGYLAMSIPILAFYLTKGASAIGSQVAGSVLSSAAFGSAGVASTATDGNWSFNNMSMDNLSQNKMDTNLMQRQGQQTWQADNGSTQTMTAGGHTVIDGSGAMSNLPVNMKLSQLASSGFQESARQSDVQAKTALDGYNHSVTSGWSQLSQLSRQSGTSDSLIRGSENSQATNATRGASMMMSAVENYAKSNNISTQEAYNQLMNISNEGTLSAGAKATVGGGMNLGVVKFGGEGHMSSEVRHNTGSSRGTQDSNSHTEDTRHDRNSQAVNDFRQGMDMVTSSRVTDGSNHTESAATNDVQQLASTLNDAQSQYQQYTTSSTQSNEYSRMATLAQNQSANLDTNYTQEFVDWATDKYGDRAQGMLTSAPSAREAAMEFVNERLKPEIMGDYQQGRADLSSGNEHAAFSGDHIVHPSAGSNSNSGNNSQGHYPVSAGTYPSGSQSAGGTRHGNTSSEYPVTGQQAPSGGYRETAAGQPGNDPRSGMVHYQGAMNGHNSTETQSGSLDPSGSPQRFAGQQNDQRNVGGQNTEDGRINAGIHGQMMSPEQSGPASLNTGNVPQVATQYPSGTGMQTTSRSASGNQQALTDPHNEQQPNVNQGIDNGRDNAGLNGQQPLSAGRNEIQPGHRAPAGQIIVNAPQDTVQDPSGNGMMTPYRSAPGSQQTMTDPRHNQEPNVNQGIDNGRDNAEWSRQQPLSAGRNEIQPGHRASAGQNMVNAPHDTVQDPSGTGMMTPSRSAPGSQQTLTAPHHNQQPDVNQGIDNGRDNAELNGQPPLSAGRNEIQPGHRAPAGQNTVDAPQDSVNGLSGTEMQTTSRSAPGRQQTMTDPHYNQQPNVNQGTGNGRDNAELNGQQSLFAGQSETPVMQRNPVVGNNAHQPERTVNTRSGDGEQKVAQEMPGSQHPLIDQHSGQQGLVANQNTDNGNNSESVTQQKTVSRSINETQIAQPDENARSMMHEQHGTARDQPASGKQNVPRDESGDPQNRVTQHSSQQPISGPNANPAHSAGREIVHNDHAGEAAVHYGKTEQSSHDTMSSVKSNLPDNRIDVGEMQKTFAASQAKLSERAGLSFEPQNEIQRRVAEQRSVNLQNINESAGEIEKKQSTVQTSSDILKGEDFNAQSKFQLGRKEAELDQVNPLNLAKQDELNEQILELRKRVAGGN
ncbi:conjugal transfer mating-pair stabilization protein TraG [Enterobacter sp. MYb186]